MVKSTKPVFIWLLTGAILVAAMVVIGGITRLTNSGLSMVEWKLIMGAVPPTTEAEWQATFEKYQQFPEYQKINRHYTLSDFKAIFWWEYAHRLIGRIIGIVFIVPFVYFLAKGYFNKTWRWRLLLLFAMGGLQGFLGWFMVKSGLVNNPDVSHYRLAIHLLAAFLLFAYIIWLMMDIRAPERSLIRVKTYNKVLWVVFFITLLQVIFGAFVAGLNAGLFYPTFPTMNGEFMPAVILDRYHAQGWLALTHDITSVQFIHRLLGILLFLLIAAIYNNYGPSLLKKNKTYLGLLLLTVTLQATLGVLALLFAVPLALAVIHQFTALVFLGILTVNLHASRAGFPDTV